MTTLLLFGFGFEGLEGGESGDGAHVRVDGEAEVNVFEVDALRAVLLGRVLLQRLQVHEWVTMEKNRDFLNFEALEK